MSVNSGAHAYRARRRPYLRNRHTVGEHSASTAPILDPAPVPRRSRNISPSWMEKSYVLFLLNNIVRDKILDNLLDCIPKLSRRRNCGGIS